MTCSYSGNPADSDLDATRFLLGDTDCSKNIFSDEEIAWVLTQEANPYTAAACLLDGAINTVSGTLSSKKVGELSLAWGLAETRARINDLRAKGRVKYEVPSMPAQDRDAKRDFREDTDNVDPWFFRGQHDIDHLRDTNDDGEEAQ